MPLVKSKSRATVGKNIKIEEAAGKSHRQSVAIALDVARRAGADWVKDLKGRVRKHLSKKR
jgi:hypothetical protein